MLFGTISCVFALFFNILICLIDRKSDIIKSENKLNSLNDNLKEDKDNKKKANIDLGIKFWLLTFIITFACGGIFPFLNISSGFLSSTFFKSKGSEGPLLAGRYYSVYLSTSAVLVPIFGIIMGRIKFTTYLLFLASIIGVFSFALLNNGFLYLGYILLALSYSLYSSIIWPRLAMLYLLKYT